MQKKDKRKQAKVKVLLLLSLLVVIFTLVAPYLAPNDPLKTDFTSILIEANDKYPLGTDHIGRCTYSRLLYGARATLGTAFLLIVGISVVGVLIGSLAGFSGGALDTLIMRIGDVLLAFPDIVFAIIIVGMLGAGIVNTIIALSMIWWVKYARLSRVLVKKERNSEYVHAARMVGAGEFKIYFYYIFPNILPSLVVQISLNIGSIIIALAGFSFLGLGVQAPTPEWGNMLNEGRIYIQTEPHLLIYPGLCLFVVVFLFNTLGELLRSTLNQKET